jgi:hypothetical protein
VPVVILVIVPPLPIFILVVLFQLAIIRVRPVRFHYLTIVVDAFIGIPHMIVRAVRIVGPVPDADAGAASSGRYENGGQQE